MLSRILRFILVLFLCSICCSCFLIYFGFLLCECVFSLILVPLTSVSSFPMPTQHTLDLLLFNACLLPICTSFLISGDSDGFMFSICYCSLFLTVSLSSVNELLVFRHAIAFELEKHSQVLLFLSRILRYSFFQFSSRFTHSVAGS